MRGTTTLTTIEVTILVHMRMNRLSAYSPDRQELRG